MLLWSTSNKQHSKPTLYIKKTLYIYTQTETKNSFDKQNKTITVYLTVPTLNLCYKPGISARGTLGRGVAAHPLFPSELLSVSHLFLCKKAYSLLCAFAINDDRADGFSACPYSKYLDPPLPRIHWIHSYLRVVWNGPTAYEWEQCVRT